MNSRKTPVSDDGYRQAFYEIAAMLDIEARPHSPKQVWETEMRPKLLAALLTPTEDVCPSCKGLNLSCPGGCGRDPLTGELDGSTFVRTPKPIEVERAVAEWRRFAEAASRGEVDDPPFAAVETIIASLSVEREDDIRRLVENLRFLASKDDGPGNICRVPQREIQRAADTIERLQRSSDSGVSRP